MSRKPRTREPMFDFTPVSQGVAALLLVWMASFLVLIPVALISTDAGRFLTHWREAIFPIGAFVLLLEGMARLARADMTSTQLTSYRAAAVAMGPTSLTNLGTGHWILAPAGIVAAAVWFLPLRQRTQPSTWGQS